MKKLKYSIFLLFLLTLTTAGLASLKEHKVVNPSGTISGRVIDYITGKPLEGVQIKVYKRIVDILPNGAKSIRSMKEVIDLKIDGKTNGNGEYLISVPTEIDPNYFMLKSDLKDYEVMISMFVLVKANETSISNFEMTKLYPTKEETKLIQRKASERNKKIEIEKIKDIEKNPH